MSRDTGDSPADNTAEDHEDPVLAAAGSVSHGAVVSLGGFGALKTLMFLLNLALTRGLPVSLYGVYALGWRINGILRMFAPLGSGTALVRYLPANEDDPAAQNRFFGLAVLTTLVASLAFAVGLFAFANRINDLTLNHSLLPPVLRLFAVLVPLNAVVGLAATVFRTREQVGYQLFLTHLVRPGTRLAAVLLALAAGLSVAGAVGGMVVATAVLLGVAVWLLWKRTDLRPSFPPRRAEARGFYGQAGPNTLSQVGYLFQSRIDVLLIGLFLTASAAGIYNIALFLTSILAIPLLAFNQLLPPIASRLYAEDEMRTLNETYGTVTRLIFTPTVALAAAAIVYRHELLALFGPSYTEGGLVLVVFVLGRVVGNGVGATAWLLMMTDHQYLNMVSSWALGLLNLGASYVFILEFGLVGAALGTSGAVAVVNLVRLALLYYTEGLQPFDRTYLKPLAAAVGMGGVMLVLRPLLPGAIQLVVGTAAGVGAFLALLWLLGIEHRERELVGMLAAEYRRATLDYITRLRG